MYNIKNNLAGFYSSKYQPLDSFTEPRGFPIFLHFELHKLRFSKKALYLSVKCSKNFCKYLLFSLDILCATQYNTVIHH